jgi:DHA1 family bicyclomycin/chloramphenicol resistance-like MFS transporter
MSYITSSSFLYIDMLGNNPRQFGLLFGLNAMGLIGASQLNRRVLRTQRLETVAQRALFAAVTIAMVMIGCALSGAVTTPILSALLLFVVCLFWLYYAQYRRLSLWACPLAAWAALLPSKAPSSPSSAV